MNLEPGGHLGGTSIMYLGSGTKSADRASNGCILLLTASHFDGIIKSITTKLNRRTVIKCVAFFE